MAKSKYDAKTFPLLAEGYARDGLSDEQIAVKLGISVQTYYSYQKKYFEFFEAIKKGKAPVDTRVENAVLKRAEGYEVEEVRTEIIKDADGNVVSTKIIKNKKHIPASETAQIFWLANRKSDKWRRKDKEEQSDTNQTIQLEFVVDKTEKED